MTKKYSLMYENKSSCNIYLLIMHTPRFKNFSYVILDNNTKEAAIVDPSWNFQIVMNLVNELKINLTKILLTHSHFDHVNIVNKIVNYFDSQVFMSKDEIEFYNFKCKNLHSFNKCDLLSCGKTQFFCILTPGHTSGSACFFTNGHLFTGDTIFTEGCGICNTKGGDPSAMYDSIQKIKELISPETRIYPGHSYGENPGQSLEYIIKRNIYFCIENKEDFINFLYKSRQNQLQDAFLPS